MSGIFGYIGTAPCQAVLMNGLERLQSRGNELCGMALMEKEKPLLIKLRGNVQALGESLKTHESSATGGIAECADAARCKPTTLTAKPAANDTFAVVCDGEIENFDYLKKWAQEPFPTATEEDLLLALLRVFHTENHLQLAKRLAESLLGNPSFAFFAKGEDAIICKAGNAPLAIGVGDNGCCFAGEVQALAGQCRRYLILESGEYAKLTAHKVTLLDKKLKRLKKPLLPLPALPSAKAVPLSQDLLACPACTKEVFHRFVKGGKLQAHALKPGKHFFDKAEKILLVGEGDMQAIARLCAFQLSALCDIPCYAFSAEELRFSGMPMNKNTLVIALSHRGEDAVILQGVRRAKAGGAILLGITGNRLSALAREATLLLPYGEEAPPLSGMAAGYMSMCFFMLYAGYKSGIVSELYLNVSLKMAEMLPGKIASASKETPALTMAAQRLENAKQVITTGLLADGALAEEAARALRAMAGLNAFYVDSETLCRFPKEQLSDVTVLSFLTNRDRLPKVLPFLRLLQTRGAHLLLFCTESMAEELSLSAEVLTFHDSIPLFNALPCLALLHKTALLLRDIKEENDFDEAV